MENRINTIVQLVVVLGMLLSVQGQAQIANVHTVSGQPIMVQKAYDGVQGTPYFTPEWKTGTVVYNQQRMENVQMKYNAFEDQIEILYNNAPFLPDKKMVQGFEFFLASESTGAVNYQFKNGFEGDGIKKENYLSVIYEGSELALAERIKMDQISVTPATYGEREYKEFTLSKTYVLIKKGKAQRFKPFKKSFAKEFPTVDAKLKTYFKEHEVNFGSYDDLSKLMGFIDTSLINN